MHERPRVVPGFGLDDLVGDIRQGGILDRPARRFGVEGDEEVPPAIVPPPLPVGLAKHEAQPSRQLARTGGKVQGAQLSLVEKWGLHRAFVDLARVRRSQCHGRQRPFPAVPARPPVQEQRALQVGGQRHLDAGFRPVHGDGQGVAFVQGVQAFVTRRLRAGQRARRHRWRAGKRPRRGQGDAVVAALVAVPARGLGVAQGELEKGESPGGLDVQGQAILGCGQGGVDGTVGRRGISWPGGFRRLPPQRTRMAREPPMQDARGAGQLVDHEVESLVARAHRRLQDDAARGRDLLRDFVLHSALVPLANAVASPSGRSSTNPRLCTSKQAAVTRNTIDSPPQAGWSPSAPKPRASPHRCGGGRNRRAIRESAPDGRKSVAWRTLPWCHW